MVMNVFNPRTPKAEAGEPPFLETSLVYTVRVPNQSALHSETPSHTTKTQKCLVQEVAKKYIYLLVCPCKIRLKENNSLLLINILTCTLYYEQGKCTLVTFQSFTYGTLNTTATVLHVSLYIHGNPGSDRSRKPESNGRQTHTAESKGKSWKAVGKQHLLPESSKLGYRRWFHYVS